MAKNNKKVVFSFGQLEIGDVLYEHQESLDAFYFISDRTEREVYYTTYLFFKERTDIEKRKCTARDYKKSILSGATRKAMHGELVKRLIESPIKITQS